ncbi:hypothetical protein I3842_10G130400 [Carya illinoinensis]|uniref:Uncharacterized protein n=1 Tax=Carya illinoinensis TaxID=32201 RepID=A0A922DZP0_CARIL|nr:hypothetical protein I3842_10G130400 [Carya illinoinensis]
MAEPSYASHQKTAERTTPWSRDTKAPSRSDHGISPVLSENSSSHHVALSTCSLVSKDSQHHHRVVHCPTPPHDLYKERHRPAQPRTTCRKEKKTLFFSLKTEQNLHAYQPPTLCTDAAPSRSYLAQRQRHHYSKPARPSTPTTAMPAKINS